MLHTLLAASNSATYHQQREHGLSHIESVPPVVVGDRAVPFPHSVHPPRKNLLPKNNTVQTLEQNSKGLEAPGHAYLKKCVGPVDRV